ncbi:unnamed protein product, partial [marine sediment metagenome]
NPLLDCVAILQMKPKAELRSHFSYEIHVGFA